MYIYECVCMYVCMYAYYIYIYILYIYIDVHVLTVDLTLIKFIPRVSSRHRAPRSLSIHR